MEVPADTIRWLYKIYKGGEKTLKEQGYSDEEAFWIEFATTSAQMWDDDAEIEVKLSEIFRLYLTIYSEKIDKEMKIEDEAAFMKLLKEKYDQVNKIFEPENISMAGLELGRVILGADANPYKQLMAAAYVLSVTYRVELMPFKLVKDV